MRKVPMSWWRFKRDPWKARERELKSRILTLEQEIRLLEQRLSNAAGGVGSDSGASSSAEDAPPGDPGARFGEVKRALPAVGEKEPALVEIRPVRPRLGPSSPPPPELYNEFGVRRYDLPAAWRRWRERLRGARASSPELVQLLAAGGAPGLRSLRVEQRIARNRALALLIGLALVVAGILLAIFRSP